MSEHEPPDMTSALVMAAGAIVEEMNGRLEASFGENDSLAVASAINRALSEGVRIAQQAVDIEMWSHNIDVQFYADERAAMPDVWAERYGQDAGDE